jgi:branched-chain amino acid transport system substrate-binding protein
LVLILLLPADKMVLLFERSVKQMKKRNLAILAVAVMSASILSACGAKDNTNAAANEILIGGIGPLTGGASTYGQSVRDGAELYIKEVNAAGGIDGKKVRLVFEDDQADGTLASNAFNKLVDNDKVTAILGGVTSGATLAIANKATQSKIPMITPSATEPSVTEVGGEYMFRVCYVDSYQGIALANYSYDTLKNTKVAILYNVASDYSKGIADSFKAAFEAKGGTVTSFLSYNEGDKDFSAQLTQIAGVDAEALLLPDYYGTVGLIAKQARNAGIVAQILGGDGWESDELYGIGGVGVDGARYITHYFSGDQAPVVADFVKAFNDAYSKQPDGFSALSYDAMKVLLDAIDAADSTDGAAIQAQMLKTQLEGVTGKMTFGEDRTAVKGAVILEVEKDNLKLVDKVNP